ncbi:hypothetical protein V6N13_106016 [Hibiscus sabdariffa]
MYNLRPWRGRLDHVIRSCTQARNLWCRVIDPDKLSTFLHSPFDNWLRFNLLDNSTSGPQHEDILTCGNILAAEYAHDFTPSARQLSSGSVPPRSWSRPVPGWREWKLVVRHVSRDCNHLADRIAALGRTSSRSGMVIADSPASLAALVEEEAGRVLVDSDMAAWVRDGHTACFNMLAWGFQVDPLIEQVTDGHDGAKPPLLTAEHHFSLFKKRFKKSYGSNEEHGYRFKVFQHNLRRAARHQKLDPSTTHGVTQFSDLTPGEFRKMYLGLRKLRLPEDARALEGANFSATGKLVIKPQSWRTYAGGGLPLHRHGDRRSCKFDKSKINAANSSCSGYQCGVHANLHWGVSFLPIQNG